MDECIFPPLTSSINPINMKMTSGGCVCINATNDSKLIHDNKGNDASNKSASFSFYKQVIKGLTEFKSRYFLSSQSGNPKPKVLFATPTNHRINNEFFMKTWLRRSGLIAVLMIANLILTSAVFGQEPTLTTDSADYQPGSTCTLTGTGFQPGESVRIQVLHADYVPGDPITGEDHDPWFVTADTSGNFVTTWVVCEDDCRGELLRAIADGQTSGLNAEILFTDTTKTWDGSNGTAWNDPANWTPSGVPLLADDVIIPFWFYSGCLCQYIM